MSIYAEMGKADLRAACKLASISYSKLDNAGMRAALEAATQPTETYEQKQARIAATDYTDEQLTAMDENGVEADMTEGQYQRGHCPDCGIHLSNGIAHYADICDSNPKEAGKMVREWTCLGCGAEWGEKLRHNTTSRATGTGLKIEANREERNGIKRPSAGGKCRAIWDYLDSAPASKAKDVKAVAAERGWNPNNAVIEFYQWRKFNA